MHIGLSIPQSGELGFLALGAIVRRLDPGIIPFCKANACQVHARGGGFNVAGNLSDGLRTKTGLATAMVNDPVGDMIAERVRAMGVMTLCKRFGHDGVHGPNMALLTTFPGDTTMSTSEQVRALAKGGSAHIQRSFQILWNLLEISH